MQASDLLIIVLGLAIGNHLGTLLNYVVFKYLIAEDDDEDDDPANA